MRPSEVLPSWFRLQKSEKIAEEIAVNKALTLSQDPAEFFRQVVGFEPTEYQRDFIEKFLDNQFIAARWCRQSGKSWIISALLLWYALTHPDSYIGVVAPSWRQAKLVIRRISSFVRRLPPGMILKAQRTIIYATNGAIIEAFPNSPETIRGPSLDVVFCDELNFIANDEEMYDAILFTLGTTEGKFVCSSTPWTTESVFWKIFNHKDFSDFARSHVTWRDAVEPHGPLKKNILEKIRRQLAEDQMRWRREMEAEWSEDQDVWLPQSLIAKCVSSEYELYGFESVQQGDFYAGLDLGKHQDYSVLAVIEKVDGGGLVLRLLKIFPLETSYATVIGYCKALHDRWGGFCKIRVDMTGVGEYIVEDMVNAEIENVEGVMFTANRKQEMASLLKQRMIDGRFVFPYFTWERPCRGDFPSELNVERFQLRKDGTTGFSHPRGTHDDVFWATALALYATCEMAPEPFLSVLPRRLSRRLGRFRLHRRRSGRR